MLILALFPIMQLQVGNGATDFTPTPAESREIIRKGYTTPTLLVRFANDAIGGTQEHAEDGILFK
jgi:hypothetical protein